MCEAEIARNRPCHLCGEARSVSYVDTKRYPGKLLCATCAGVDPLLTQERLHRLLVVVRDSLKAEGTFEKRQAVEKLETMIKELE